MGYFESARRKLRTPESGNAPLLTPDLRLFATELDVGGPLLLNTVSSSVQAFAGELLRQTSSGSTITAPPPELNREFGVFNSSSGIITIRPFKLGGNPSVGRFLGDNLLTETEVITLAQGQHVRFQSDGTNWWITGGEVQKSSTWVAQAGINLGEEIGPLSLSRETEVIVETEGVRGQTYEATIEVGGVVVAVPAAPPSPLTGHNGYGLATTIRLLPGEVFKVVNTHEVARALIAWRTQ